MLYRHVHLAFANPFTPPYFRVSMLKALRSSGRVREYGDGGARLFGRDGGGADLVPGDRRSADFLVTLVSSTGNRTGMMTSWFMEFPPAAKGCTVLILL